MGNDFKYVGVLVIVVIASLFLFDAGKNYVAGMATRSSSSSSFSLPAGQQQGKFCSDPTDHYDNYVPCTPQTFLKQGTWCPPDNKGIQIQGCQEETGTKCTSDKLIPPGSSGIWCTCFYTCSTPSLF